MTHDEATEHAAKMNKLAGVTATVCRILPEGIDPIKPGDNGFDVEIVTDDYAAEAGGFNDADVSGAWGSDGYLDVMDEYDAE